MLEALGVPVTPGELELVLGVLGVPVAPGGLGKLAPAGGGDVGMLEALGTWCWTTLTTETQ